MADRLVNEITVSAFCKESEDYAAIKDMVLRIFPFDVAGLNLVEEHTALGFNNKKIRQISINLQKQQHIKEFLESFLGRLEQWQKEQLAAQKESRLSDELYFYIRLDKENLLGDQIVLTESGECVHIKMSIAAFPKRREVALGNVDKLFK